MTNFLLLLYIALFSAAMLITMATSRQNGDFLWGIIHGAILCVAAAAYNFNWAGAGYVLAAVTVIFVITPVALSMAARKAWQLDKQQAGIRLLKLATFLHPSPTWRLRAAMEEAATEPSLAGQCALFDRIIERFPERFTLTARLLRMRLVSDWEGILATRTAQGLRPEPFHLMLIIRALGETGQLNEMVEMLLANYATLANAQLLNQTLLGVAQLTGRTHPLFFLMAQPDNWALTEEQRRWVENITHLIAGDATARARLQQQTDRTEDPDARQVRQRRLDIPFADPATTLRPEIAKALDEFIARRMDRTVDVLGKHQRLAVATFGLLAVNACFFGAELFLGDPENTETLVQLGGLWPPLVMAGDYWRLGSAMFLHAGWAHLLFNMAMLFSLGSSYERRNGSWAMLVLYGLGGLISMATVLTLMWQDYTPIAVLVGASGAIFALLGGMTIDAVRLWFKTGMKDDRNALFTIALCLVFQAVFDQLVPAVSFSAHVSGFFAGMAIGVILNLVRR